VVACYRDMDVPFYFRADAAFANPEIYEYLEEEAYGYRRRRGERGPGDASANDRGAGRKCASGASGQGFCRLGVMMACSPKIDPSVMRVGGA